MVSTRSAKPEDDPSQEDGPNTSDPLRVGPSSKIATRQQSSEPEVEDVDKEDEEVKEKDVREKLKKTHVEETENEAAVQQTSPHLSASGDDAAPATSTDRGRPRRKRSFEEINAEGNDEPTSGTKLKHVRKRSKGDDSNESKDSSHDEHADHDAGRPTTKKSSSPADTNGSNSENVTKDSKDDSSPRDEDSHAASSSNSKGQEGKTKDQPDLGKSSKGFSDISVTSPFAGLGASGKSVFGNVKPAVSEPATGASASFASFAAAGSSSPFASIGDSTNKLETSNNTSSTASPPASFSSGGFAALAGKPSIFGSATTFASISGSTAGSSVFYPTGRLTTFASGKGNFGSSSTDSSKTTKPFGAPADEDDGENSGGDSDTDHAGQDGAIGSSTEADQPQDKRFYEQDIETGEENEVTIFSERAKLYISENKQWKERCSGNFKVNKRKEAENGADVDTVHAPSSRFIMRSDASHKVLLNSPITKEISLDDPMKGPPKGKQAIFMGFVEGTPRMMLIKMRNEDRMAELAGLVTQLKGEI